MYLQITTHCDMACAHCCFSCRPGRGHHMELSAVKQAMDFSKQFDQWHITIGGGEPTLHPHFWKVLEKIRSQRHVDRVSLVTNGSRTQDALRLIKVAKRSNDTFFVALSQDKWHAKIDPYVVEAFTEASKEKDCICVSINRISTAAALGRALDEVREPLRKVNGCCGGPFITPQGTIWGCEHRNFRLGTVTNWQVPRGFFQNEGDDCGQNKLRQGLKPYPFGFITTKDPRQLEFKLRDRRTWITKRKL